MSSPTALLAWRSWSVPLSSGRNDVLTFALRVITIGSALMVFRRATRLVVALGHRRVPRGMEHADHTPHILPMLRFRAHMYDLGDLTEVRLWRGSDADSLFSGLILVA